MLRQQGNDFRLDIVVPGEYTFVSESQPDICLDSYFAAGDSVVGFRPMRYGFTIRVYNPFEEFLDIHG
jgi:hypothetical protein